MTDDDGFSSIIDRSIAAGQSCGFSLSRSERVRYRCTPASCQPVLDRSSRTLTRLTYLTARYRLFSPDDAVDRRRPAHCRLCCEKNSAHDHSLSYKRVSLSTDELLLTFSIQVTAGFESRTAQARRAGSAPTRLVRRATARRFAPNSARAGSRRRRFTVPPPFSMWISFFSSSRLVGAVVVDETS